LANFSQNISISMSLHGAKQAHDVLAIIPARGGSKGLPGKNIKKIAGLPLLSWTIDQAKKSRLIDRVIVSTEDPKIKQTAKCFNAEVIDRPVEFASDTSSVMDAIRHSLLVLEKEKYQLIQRN
jgi:CMP-N-acetylneuraminic acid synthetase